MLVVQLSAKRDIKKSDTKRTPVGCPENRYVRPQNVTTVAKHFENKSYYFRSYNLVTIILLSGIVNGNVNNITHSFSIVGIFDDHFYGIQGRRNVPQCRPTLYLQKTSHHT